MPKHMPRKGISVSLANLIAEIFPSIPRLPNPPGIKIPSYRLALSKPMSFSHLNQYAQL